jgi:predicted ATPase
MLLKEIKLTNFKGIKETVSIPLAPITLLFGGNSSGKSTVLQSLLYLYEILVNKNLDPVKSTKQGSNCLLNGFENLVHCKDLSKTISIEVELDISEVILDSFLSETEESFIQNSLDEKSTFALNEPTINSVNLKLDIAYSENAGPFIKKTSVSIDNELFAEINQETSSKRIWMELAPDNVGKLNEIYSDPAVSKIIEDGVGTGSVIYLDNTKSTVPNQNSRININESSWTDGGDFGDNPFIGKLILEAILSQLVSSPFKVLTKELNKLLHIGPVRDIPVRGYAPNKLPTDWYSGLAGWDRFAFAEAKLKDKVNSAFSEHGFNSKYKFITKGFYNHVIVEDTKLNITNEPVELGIGISQIFPFIVAASDEKASFVSVEQPELHIHPSWQLKIADILIDSIKANPQRMFLIETHSEHLMLRLLNRVRMQEGDEGFDESLKIEPENISAVCVYPHEGKPYYQRQTVTDDGDFELDWPEGFFEERFGEL